MFTPGLSRSFRARPWRGKFAAIFLIVFGFALPAALALNPRLEFLQYCRQNWNTETALPFNDRSIFALAQTPDGYLWIGADKGLLRFDGLRFTVFDTKTVPAMKCDTNRVLCVAADGSLWSGTPCGGLLHFQDGQFTSLTREQGLFSDDIRAIAEAPAGTLWIGTTRGLNRLQTNQVSAITLENAPPGTGVSAICVARDGAIWLGLMDGGLMRKEGEHYSTELPGGHGQAPIVRLLETRDRALWLGDQTGKVLRRQKGAWQEVMTSTGAAHVFMDFLEDRDGALWISMFKSGVFRWCGNDLCQQQPPRGFFVEQDLALAEDREGGVWFAGGSGELTRLHEGPVVTFAASEGLSDDSARTVLAARDGSVWVGTEKGLNHIQDGRIAEFPLAQEFKGKFILSLAEGLDGSLWVGTISNSLKRIKDGRVITYNAPTEMGTNEIRALLIARDGTLWIGTRRNGLARFDGEHFMRLTQADGLASDEVRIIRETSDGSLWLGLERSGLTRYQGGKFTNYGPRDGLGNDQVRAIHEDSDGVLWIGTNDGGLSRLKDGRLRTFTPDDGLANEAIFFIHEDAQARLWMSSKRGIFSVARKELNDCADGRGAKLHCRVYGTADGMKSIECNGGVCPAGGVTRAGELWLPTIRGVVRIATDRAPAALAPPPSRIEYAAIDQQTLRSAVALPRQTGQRRFEFRFTALTFQDTGKIRFRYRLENFDRDWNDAGPQRKAEYTGVPPGEYTFRVQAGTPDGQWETTGSSLPFVLSARFYQTRWFWAGCAGLLVVGAAVAYQIRLRVLHRIHELERARAVELERARIFKDMHDGLGANLMQISLLCERIAEVVHQPAALKTHLAEIAAAVRENFQALSEIVWAVNPQHDKLESLVNFICKFAENYLRLAGLRCRLDLPENVPPLALSFARRQHLFLVIKEALTNTVKHARASEVWFRLQITAAEIVFCVQDNGRGFSMARVSEFENGLSNMRRRAEAAGGRFELHSLPGKGTTLRVHLPVTPDILPPLNHHRRLEKVT